MRAKTSAQGGQQRQCNDGNNNRAMLATMLPQCRQGRQCNADKDASAALAGPSKAKLPWNNAGHGNKATGDNQGHSNNATYADVLQLHCDWADASLQCWR
jgi:hypothetical protein